MSTFAEIYNFNHQPIRDVQREQLAILWNGLQANGPDGGDILFAGSVGMCYRAFDVNEQSRFELQPLTGPNNTMIAGSLRLDNRKELISSLGHLLPKASVQITDIELALAAYQTWAEMFPSHLVGEFALMVFDGTTQKTLLTRDHIGARTLYYHYDKERLICSSDLGPLVEATRIPLEINNDYVAGYLMYDPEPELTVYKDIHSVKPFHVVTFNASGVRREERYWDLAKVKPIRFKTDEEYDEGFRFHFTNAVRGPLRTDGPVFSDLSGGLDSSSIVCVAHQLIENCDVPAPELFTVSLVSTGSPTSDQTKYIRLIEKHVGRTGYHIDETDYPLFSTLSTENALSNLNPLLFCEAKHRRISNLMERTNARVLLSGVGGDEIACAQQNSAPELADLLAAFRFRSFHQRVKAWSQRTKRPYLTLLRDAVRLLLPHQLRMRHETKMPGIVPNFLLDQFVHDFSLRSRHVARSPFACNTPSANDQALGFWTAVRSIAAGWRSEMTRGYISYPFLARPLVEYMQAIPHTQRVQLGKSRFLMRRALTGVLPEAIVKRRDKGNPQETIARSFMNEWSRLRPFFEDSRIGSHGYVNQRSFVSAVEDYRLGKDIHLGMLLKFLSFEFWLRRLERLEPAFNGRSSPSLRSLAQGQTALARTV
jgi:asparagine synthase (glutamine-hydrolysing)